ncbi:MAG TPA: ketoacyl-ACP synthase III [Candidatus Gallacutalibacter stercoravium]|nr:ketoacyl-ACP synthase III [Candidatus Gallacutalibacter stercoravium]
MSFRILGTGRALPEYVMTNDEMSTIVDTSDEWIRTRTGIAQRRVCTTESIGDLAVQAAENALQNAGIAAQDLDLIVCATIRGEYFSPSEACVVQKRIGACCPAFDVNAACTGFLYGLDVADGFFARKRVKKVLVVAAENVTNCLDWTDRATCVLFGDGAGAAVLGEGNDLLAIRMESHGNIEALNIPRGENTSPFYQLGSQRPVLHMNGREVYKFAVNAMSSGLIQVIADAGLQQSDIDYVLPHQANQRIIDAACAKLDIPKERCVTNIARYGNISAACIPVLLDEMNRDGRLKPGNLLAMSAFGGGLTAGHCVLRWSKEG